MPEKLERELKAKAAKKDWSEERKDAYVYGTLRKTGWKPSREKKKEKQMSVPEKIIQLNKKMDDLIEFGGAPGDPTAGMFGCYQPVDPIAQSYEDASQVSALQRLKLKIAALRGMGLHSDGTFQ